MPFCALHLSIIQSPIYTFIIHYPYIYLSSIHLQTHIHPITPPFIHSFIYPLSFHPSFIPSFIYPLFIHSSFSIPLHSHTQTYTHYLSILDSTSTNSSTHLHIYFFHPFSICPYIYLLIHITCLSIHQSSIHLFYISSRHLPPTLHLPMHPHIHPPLIIHPSSIQETHTYVIHPSILDSIHQSTHPSIHLYICSSLIIYPSIHTSIL